MVTHQNNVCYPVSDRDPSKINKPMRPDQKDQDMKNGSKVCS